MTLDIAQIEEAIRLPFQEWAQQCHAISLAIVRSGLVEGRVARGWCKGVSSQHSWIVLGQDCYDRKARLIDPVLWSFREDVEGIWYGTYHDGLHEPHGWGHFTSGRRPTHQGGETIPFPREGLSAGAKAFLDVVEPLDTSGWIQFFDLPVEGWPAAEIIARAHESDLSAYIPIDRVGMLTDTNPDGLYR